MAESANDLADALSPLLEARGLDLVDVDAPRRRARPFSSTVKAASTSTRSATPPAPCRPPSTRSTRIPGRYTLTVSSPGLERRLRTPAHFMRAVGEAVTVRMHAGTDDVRRVSGTLESADETGFTLVGPDLPDGSLAGGLRRDRAGPHRFCVGTAAEESERVSRS